MNDYFETKDLFLTNTLVSLGYHLEAVHVGKDRRAEFCFKREGRLDDLIQKYWAKALLVEPQEFCVNLKMLKSRIYSQINYE